MPSYTSFLNLSLPALSEFVDSWNEPLNQNFEDIDDWTEDLHAGLVGTGGSSVWASLRGSTASLAARLDVSILATGEINISGSADILNMATSAYKGQYSNPRDRLNDGDRENYEAGQPFANGRFVPTGTAGPTAGQAFPHGELDAGIALRSADFGAHSAEPISSPQKAWAPGLILGGAEPFITATAVAGQVQLNAASAPAIFNVDGYAFRLREDLVFDYSLLGSLAPNDYVWIYVDRDEAKYGEASFKYCEPGGTPVAKDLRKLKSGSDGTTAGSTFSVVSGTFDTAPYKVKQGDVLVITSGTAAGEYVIDALDGTIPNTKFTIKGVFKDDLGPSVPYEIIDQAMPHIGAAISAGTPSDPTERPPFVAGRVYIGRVKHLGGSPPSPRVTFIRGGIYDSGWESAPTFPKVFTHELGSVPSRVEVWVREDSTAEAYRPMVLRQILTNFDEGNTTVDVGDAKKVSLLFPSMAHRANELTATVDIINASIDPAKPVAMFTYDLTGSPTDVVAAAGEIRLIAWR